MSIICWSVASSKKNIQLLPIHSFQNYCKNFSPFCICSSQWTCLMRKIVHREIIYGKWMEYSRQILLHNSSSFGRRLLDFGEWSSCGLNLRHIPSLIWHDKSILPNWTSHCCIKIRIIIKHILHFDIWQSSFCLYLCVELWFETKLFTGSLQAECGFADEIDDNKNIEKEMAWNWRKDFSLSKSLVSAPNNLGFVDLACRSPFPFYPFASIHSSPKHNTIIFINKKVPGKKHLGLA